MRSDTNIDPNNCYDLRYFGLCYFKHMLPLRSYVWRPSGSNFVVCKSAVTSQLYFPPICCNFVTIPSNPLYPHGTTPDGLVHQSLAVPLLQPPSTVWHAPSAKALEKRMR